MMISPSARTYQLLYVLRRLSIAGKPTTPDAVLDFVAELHAAAPVTYSRARMGRTDCEKMFPRHVTEGILVQNPDGNYGMTPAGSLMIDVLEGIDACTDDFYENFRTVVTAETLRYMSRIDMNKTTAVEEIAAVSGLSEKIVSASVTTLEASGQIFSHKKGRIREYSLFGPVPVRTLGVTPSVETTIPPVVAPSIPVVTPVPLLGDFDDSPVVISMDGPVVAPPLTDVPGGLGLLTFTFPPGTTPAFITEDTTPVVPEIMLPDPPGLVVEPHSRDEWDMIPADIRRAFVAKAAAAEIPLSSFLAALNERLTKSIRAVLVPGI